MILKMKERIFKPVNAGGTTVNVSIISDAFYMPQLGCSRRIWIYQPPESQYSLTKKYPVIYMHDGQNLFDENTAFDDEWGIDESLNALQAECIIVGIDSGENRMTEYNFHDNKKHGKGRGRQYIDFIAATLKPYIDAHYNTRPERMFTHIAGSSMGGLISLYGALYYPKIFGGAGVFSPSLWLVDGAVTELADVVLQNKHYSQLVYFYGGGKEKCDVVMHITNVANLLSQHPCYKVKLEIDPNGEHTELHWRTKFPGYYKWIFDQ